MITISLQYSVHHNCDYVEPVSKTLDIIQVLIAYRLHYYKQVSTLQEGVNSLYKQAGATC